MSDGSLLAVVGVVLAPVALVLVALLLAAVREHAGPCSPRRKCVWQFLRSLSDPAGPGLPAASPGRG